MRQKLLRNRLTGGPETVEGISEEDKKRIALGSLQVGARICSPFPMHIVDVSDIDHREEEEKVDVLRRTSLGSVLTVTHNSISDQVHAFADKRHLCSI